MESAMLWVPLTLIAAATQVVRNSAQANLTGKIGTLGGTQVRFVFGLPFAALLLAAALLVEGVHFPAFNRAALLWTALGAICQIAGTALMLLVMHRRAFGVAYAYIKTEPVIVAMLGVLLLGDKLPLLAWLAVLVVTAGVLIASVKPGEFGKLLGEGGMILSGAAAGGLFGLSAIAFRGGIGALAEDDFIIRSLTVLVIALVIQTLLLGLWLGFCDRAAFLGSLREWRGSIGAGFAGALSSAFWFAAFALTAAANVRTLALIELPMVALASGRLTGRAMARHELLGLGIVMGGVALLLAANVG
ncbi:MAG: EamA family transporter [Novosphingobium sp.]